MKNKNIIFMGTPLIATEYLNALIQNKFNISAIYTQPPKKQSRGMKLIKSPVNLLGDDRNIDVFNPNYFNLKTIDNLKNQNPDLIIVMAYGKLLPAEILAIPKFGCINVHVSILPRWRGAAPIEYSLINGDKETGISIIKLTEQLDAGPILVQEKLVIPENCNRLQLSNLLTNIGTKLLVRTIPKIFKNEISLTNQDENYVTYANKITSESRKINFNNSVKSIINQIRAHAPKPGAWFYLNQERIKIIDAKPGKTKGEVSKILNKNFEIGCNGGSIDPQILQKEGKNIVTKQEFLRGFKFKIDDVINA